MIRRQPANALDPNSTSKPFDQDAPTVSTEPLAVQLIDGALRQMHGRKSISVEWFHNVLLDVRSAVSASVGTESLSAH